MRPFGIVCGLGLLTVLLPPYDVSLGRAGPARRSSTSPSWACSIESSRRQPTHLGRPGGGLPRVRFRRPRPRGWGRRSSSGLSSLLFVPILWLAITGTRRELYIASLLAAGVILGPVLFVGAPHYPVEDWRRAFILVAITVVLGRVVQRIVTRLERETRAARAATEQSERLFLDAPHGVAVLDTEGRIEFVNAALCGIVGLPPDELEGTALVDLAPPGDAAIANHLARVHEDVSHSNASDCVLRDYRGQDVHVALSSRLLRRIGSDELDIVLVNVVDVSERRRYQDRLAHLVDHDVLTGWPTGAASTTELAAAPRALPRYGPTVRCCCSTSTTSSRSTTPSATTPATSCSSPSRGLLRRSVREHRRRRPPRRRRVRASCSPTATRRAPRAWPG